jgi:hypothetical protein
LTVFDPGRLDEVKPIPRWRAILGLLSPICFAGILILIFGLLNDDWFSMSYVVPVLLATGVGAVLAYVAIRKRIE